MVDVTILIHSQSIGEGQAADVIHAIALEMMVRRARLLQSAVKGPKVESRVYRKQSRLLEEYATALDALYYQLEPTKWDPETSGELLRFAQAYHIALPDWMLVDRMQPVMARKNEIIQETTEDSIGRFENEGGRSDEGF